MNYALALQTIDNDILPLKLKKKTFLHDNNKANKPDANHINSVLKFSF